MKYFAGLGLIFLIGCAGSADKKIERSFYFWKTSFTNNSNATAYIKKEGIDHFYIRYFDVDWDENRYMPVPVAEITGLSNSGPFIQSHFTPVIFITNRCFAKADNFSSDALPSKIRSKISYITNRLQQANPAVSFRIDEIQIDCDWTERTREKYFLFLKNLKKLYPDKLISATIRLYPYKYSEKTGVPPVDKGLLMCYNLTDIKNTGNSNSIFDTKDLESYLVSKKYPLPLDIALPVFGWYAWFSEGKFNGIIYPNEKDLLTADKRFFKQTGNNFLLTGDTVVNNNYLRQGDLLRLEFPDKDQLEKAVGILRNKLPRAKRIALFYWNEFLIQKNEAVIHKIYTTY